MSQLDHSLGPTSGHPTLADVIARVDAHSGLAPRYKRELKSALHTFCRAADADPATVPAELNHVREIFRRLSPAQAEVSRGRWNNIRCLMLAALRHTGVRTLGTRSALAPAWSA